MTEYFLDYSKGGIELVPLLMHRRKFITYNGCLMALRLNSLEESLQRRAALDITSNQRNYKEQKNKLNETKTRQPENSEGKIFYKTTGPISSTNQCRFEKGRGRETVIESYNLIQGMVLDWILIGKKAVKHILGPMWCQN